MDLEKMLAQAVALGQEHKKKVKKLQTDDELMKAFPLLNAFLTVDTMGGKPVKTATLLLFQDHEGRKAMLKDRERARVAFGSGDTFYACLELLNQQIGDGSPCWKPDAFAQGKKK